MNKSARAVHEIHYSDIWFCGLWSDWPCCDRLCPPHLPDWVLLCLPHIHIRESIDLYTVSGENLLAATPPPISLPPHTCQGHQSVCHLQPFCSTLEHICLHRCLLVRLPAPPLGSGAPTRVFPGGISLLLLCRHLLLRGRRHDSLPGGVARSGDPRPVQILLHQDDTGNHHALHYFWSCGIPLIWS